MVSRFTTARVEAHCGANTYQARKAKALASDHCCASTPPKGAAPQCASTLAVVKRETNSWLWPAVMFSYMTAMAYVAALVVFNVARALGA